MIQRGDETGKAGNEEELVPLREVREELGLERLIFFSDAVFAIAITLLALDIRLPATVGQASEDDLLKSLWELGPRYLGYVLSFAVIGLIWIGHHRIFRFVRRYDARLMLLALLQLMFIAFLPFPTGVIGAHYDSRVALIFYALVLACTGVVTAILWWYATYNGRLLVEGVDMVQVRRSRWQLFVMPALFVVSAVIALWSVELTWLIWMVILVVSIVDVIVTWDRPPGKGAFGSSLAKKK